MDTLSDSYHHAFVLLTRTTHQDEFKEELEEQILEHHEMLEQDQVDHDRHRRDWHLHHSRKTSFADPGIAL